jgi:N-acetylglucosamine kinase-like BadF-type ATPase
LRRWLIGIDAGGTRTRCRAVAADGELRQGAGGPCNWTTLPARKCLSAIDAAVACLDFDRADTIGAVCLGSAGYYPEHHREMVDEALRERWPEARRRLETDLMTAWAGALGLEPGIVVIAGTGSVAFGRDAGGRQARSGGWGPLLGDEGSAYWLACRGLNAVARALDGRGPPTRLTAELLPPAATARADPAGQLRELLRDRANRETIAALAPRVLEAAGRGDAVAAALVASAAEELSALVLAVEGGLGGRDGLPWTWTGGLLAGSASLRGQVCDGLERGNSRSRLQCPRLDGAGGAVLLAEEEVEWCGTRAHLEAGNQA